jgi:chemotaxis protein methyltransferase CheR
MKERPTPTSPSVLNDLASQLAERTGLTGLTLSHENLERALALSAVAPADDLEQRMRDGGLDWNALIDALTVRETYFFRHTEHFEELRRRVLPTLRAASPLRVWSAGCASGEEAYTLAMVFDQEGMTGQLEITATDIAGAALERGRKGQYRDWSLRSLQPDLRARYFTSDGSVHTISEQLRKLVKWRQLNLAEPGYPSIHSAIGHFPLIFCRNVLMFFDAKTIAQVAARLWASLDPGGWLFLGPSDPNVSAYADFEVHVTPAGLMYRRPARPGVLARQSTVPPLPAALATQAAEPASIEVPKTVDAVALALEIRAVWNSQGPDAGLLVCEAALPRCAAEVELHHLHALLLWELKRHDEAVAALRRVLYLDADNAIAHFGLANLFERQGAIAAAQRSYQNVVSACEHLAPDAPVALGDGICAAGLSSAAADGLARLRGTEVLSP